MAYVLGLCDQEGAPLRVSHVVVIPHSILSAPLFIYTPQTLFTCTNVLHLWTL